RAVVAAILLAAAVPIVARGLIQVWIEHPQMVAEFRAHKQEILAARGWAEGSPQALTYERRLVQPEATAWFGLSNVASSALAACTQSNPEWERVRKLDTPDAYAKYEKQYSGTPEAELARTRRAALLDEREWSGASRVDTADAYAAYLVQDPRRRPRRPHLRLTDRRLFSCPRQGRDHCTHATKWGR
ncbi:MAG: hypothetical protein EBR15_05065, partial [Gammaproteobacteria bacterium]|nr:hypothetical protein [Gammaproteobacteria bacterium]